MSETNLYTITIQPMMKSLRSLSKILDKAAAHAESKATERHPASKHMESLINDRLVFDQFNLIRQVQIACDNAKGAAGRLCGADIPKFEDNERTIEELKSRIEKTLEYLQTVKPEQLIGKEEANVTLPYFKDKYFTGFQYVTEYLIPNFYFHITTAYSILRKNGVNIGKADYIGGLSLKNPQKNVAR